MNFGCGLDLIHETRGGNPLMSYVLTVDLLEDVLPKQNYAMAVHHHCAGYLAGQSAESPQAARCTLMSKGRLQWVAQFDNTSRRKEKPSCWSASSTV
jgi:hypothetical protein